MSAADAYIRLCDTWRKQQEEEGACGTVSKGSYHCGDGGCCTGDCPSGEGNTCDAKKEGNVGAEGAGESTPLLVPLSTSPDEKRKKKKNEVAACEKGKGDSVVIDIEDIDPSVRTRLCQSCGVAGCAARVTTSAENEDADTKAQIEAAKEFEEKAEKSRVKLEHALDRKRQNCLKRWFINMIFDLILFFSWISHCCCCCSSHPYPDRQDFEYVDSYKPPKDMYMVDDEAMAGSAHSDDGEKDVLIDKKDKKKKKKKHNDN